MSNNLCRFLSNGFKFLTDYGRLRVAPCCFWLGEWVYLDDPDYDNKVNGIYNLNQCTYCDNRKRDVDQTYPKARSFVDVPGDYPDGVPVYVELTLGIACNAACITCNDTLSTTWIAQNKKFGIKTVHDYPDPQDDSRVIDSIFEKFDFSQAHIINFQGGEPLWEKAVTTVKFLKRLVQTVDVSKIEIIFTTNGSCKPTTELLGLLHKFRHIRWNISIDGIGKRFEYIRYPLNWETVTKTLDYLVGQNLNQSFYINSTTGILNIFYCNEVLSWAESYAKSKSLKLPVGIVACNGVLSAYNISPKLWDVVTEKYAGNQRVRSLLTPHRPTNTQGAQSVVKYLDSLDSFRGTNWREIFPEILQYIE